MKQGFVDQHRDLFALAIALQRDNHDAAGAFDTAERARARAFQDLHLGKTGSAKVVLRP
jgi:hypothetical protein